MRYLTIFIAVFGLSCSPTPKVEQKTEPAVTAEQPIEPANEKSISSEPQTFDIKGYELFKAIRDTISSKQLTSNILTESNWRWTVLPNCYNHYQFISDSTGTSISACEIDEENQLTYQIIKDTLLITEFYIPHVDNSNGKTLKLREDKFLYTGNSIVMVNSTMFQAGIRPYEPNIEVIIEYEQLPKN